MSSVTLKLKYFNKGTKLFYKANDGSFKYGYVDSAYISGANGLNFTENQYFEVCYILELDGKFVAYIDDEVATSIRGLKHKLSEIDEWDL